MAAPLTTSILHGAGAAAIGGSITALGASLGLTTYGAVWPVLSTCAILGALVHHAKQSLAGLVENRTHTLRNRVERMRRDVGDVHGLVRLAPYTHELPLPVGGGWALTGDSAALLAREALDRKPSVVVELGSGASTLILGQILKKNGHGRLLSVDHDPMWANQTRRQVEFLGLQDVVTVLDAPLKPMTVNGEAHQWYDIPSNCLDELGKIDLLFVDGPPQSHDSAVQARYPAFPVLGEHLAGDALIFVDDAHRPTESGMVKRWIADKKEWEPRWFDTIDGVCMLTRKGKFRTEVAEPRPTSSQ